MALPNIFDKKVADQLIARINKLSPKTQAQWGKMDVARMLAHCNVTYEMVYENKYPKPNALMKFILKLAIKVTVVSDKAYKRNSSTAPQFIIVDERVFETERKRLVDFISKTQQLGEKGFEGKESHSFGALTTCEWSNMFYKHLDHHLGQFGV